MPALEAMLYEPLPVLDHGFIRVIDYMGDDAAIVQAARVSYGRGTKQVSSDRGLINYLMRHRHTSPFEMCELKLHVKLPIFVARQWIRHRTANVNEYSARYSVLDREFYIPDKDLLKLVKTPRKDEPVQEQPVRPARPRPKHTAAQSATNKQGRDEVLAPTPPPACCARSAASAAAASPSTRSCWATRSGPGIARELARMVLPLNTYTQWYWKVDLHNLLHFLRLRHDSHAQYEIRAYAEVLLDIVRNWVPLTAAAFEEYRVGGAELSAAALAVIRRRLAGEAVTPRELGPRAPASGASW